MRIEKFDNQPIRSGTVGSAGALDIYCINPIGDGLWVCEGYCAERPSRTGLVVSHELFTGFVYLRKLRLTASSVTNRPY
ncbi:MAG: hypothetical protein DRJ05_01315, partial [Bacteroidetes bacterium]